LDSDAFVPLNYVELLSKTQSFLGMLIENNSSLFRSFKEYKQVNINSLVDIYILSTIYADADVQLDILNLLSERNKESFLKCATFLK
jgi:hypothetical protein